MSETILHFWYSEKMKQASLKLDRQRTNYITIHGTKMEYTEASKDPEPLNLWGDNVYLGCLSESEFWKHYSVEEKP